LQRSPSLVKRQQGRKQKSVRKARRLRLRFEV
jgi:hypothetical protein